MRTEKNKEGRTGAKGGRKRHDLVVRGKERSEKEREGSRRRRIEEWKR